MDLIFNEAKFRISSQTLNLVTDPIKALLVNENFVPDPDMTFVDDGTPESAINFEVEGTGYESGFGATGRLLLENKVWTRDDNTDKARYDADNVIWNPINIPVDLVDAVILIHEDGDDDTATVLIAYIQSGGFPLIADGGELLVRWSDNGIFTAS